MNRLPHVASNKEMVSNLGEFRLNAGLTVAQLCERSHTKPAYYAGLNNGMISIFDRTGAVRAPALRLADTLGADPVDLWPAYFCELEQHAHAWDLQAAAHGHLASPDPETELIEREEQNTLAAAWEYAHGGLSLRERAALCHTFDTAYGVTLDDIGEVLGLTRERVRQIEKKALRRLRTRLTQFRANGGVPQ